jgi:hypothetical protein
VPEVGLELHSSPCEHWAPAETCGIRPDPTPVRPDPQPRVWTLSTPNFGTYRALGQNAASRFEGMRLLVLTNLRQKQDTCQSLHAVASRRSRDHSRVD